MTAEPLSTPLTLDRLSEEWDSIECYKRNREFHLSVFSDEDDELYTGSGKTLAEALKDLQNTING